ncbi:MAG TPA: helix-turn-helix domain-containing protein [Marmoricola sp.]|nr:helix-turn-helix domain-containing protein [Marmoricola sp.]
MKTKRSYTMGARARAVEDTRRRILDATAALSEHRRIAAISLEDVATEAGVSVQTVLRQFGSRGGLLEATRTHVQDAVTAERQAPVGDVDAAVTVLVDHYEARGPAVLLLLAQEAEDPLVLTITDDGRRMHREWVERVFAPYRPGPAVLDLLVVATDVYTWKLLRLDRGLSRTETEQRMGTLVRAVLDADVEEGAHR